MLTENISDTAQQSYSRIGVLDIGSNSVRLVIYQLFGACFSPVYNEKVLAGLGRGLRETGRLSEDGKAMAMAALKRFRILTASRNLDPVLIGATAALREASDADAFIEAVQQETGFNIHPISGAEEARLTAMGVIAAECRADGIAADLGGASLEIIDIIKGEPHPGVSFPIGPFKIIGQNLGSNNFDATDIKTQILSSIEGQDFSHATGRPLYLIGGAWRHLAAIHQDRTYYPLETLQGYTIDADEARDHARWAYGEGRQEVLNWPGVNQRRAETLPYGGLMLDVLIDVLKPSKIIISTTGLREGLIYDSLPEQLKSRDSLYDGCRDLARGNLQENHFGPPLFSFLSGVADKFPGVFEPENEQRLRRAACSLVGIGRGMHPDYRAGLVFETVFYAPLSDLAHKERAYLALILFSSYTASTKTPNSAAIHILLSEEEQLAARIYGFAIRLAVVASGRSAALLDLFELNWRSGALELSVEASHTHLISERVEHRLKKLRGLLSAEISPQA